jgi:hypothetical protein
MLYLDRIQIVLITLLTYRLLTIIGIGIHDKIHALAIMLLEVTEKVAAAMLLDVTIAAEVVMPLAVTIMVEVAMPLVAPTKLRKPIELAIKKNYYQVNQLLNAK